MGSSRFVILTRHFFRRFLDNDLISPNGDGHVGFTQAVAAVVTPGMLVACVVLFKYGMLWRPTWDRILRMSVADGLLYVSLSMIVLGTGATVTWDAFFIDARDRHILAVLPVPERLLSAAKLGALCLFLGLFVVAVNLIPTLVVPAIMVAGLRGAGLQHFVSLSLAQAVAPSLAGAWAVLAVVSLRGMLALALPGRLFQRVSPLVQGLLILGFLGWAISLSPFIDASSDIIARGGPARDFSPPLWFLGLYQSLLGNPRPEYLPLARLGLLATVVVALTVLVVFFAPRQRRSEHALAPSRSVALRPLLAWVRALASRVAVRQPLGRASFNFMLTTLGRSAKHRLYMAGALGAGLAWAATGLVLDFVRSGRAAFGTGVPSTPALQVQQVLVLFLIVAVRFSVLVPAALPANWLFRLSEGRPLRSYFAGARRAAFLIGVLPVAALVIPSAALWGWPAAGYHALVGLLFTAFLIELFFNGLTKIPFTAAYVSGQLKLKSRVGYYLFGVMALTGVPSWLESLTFRGLVGQFTLPLLLLFLAVPLAVSRWRKEGALPALVFDDTNDETIQGLRLSE